MRISPRISAFCLVTSVGCLALSLSSRRRGAAEGSADHAGHPGCENPAITGRSAAGDDERHQLFDNAPEVPVATFKFAALQLLGDPVISTGNGGPNNLALISVGDITSGPNGSQLTFGGIEQFLLARQNGSITLGGGISAARHSAADHLRAARPRT